MDRIYGIDSWDPMLEVYVIGFKVVDIATTATHHEHCCGAEPLHSLMLLLPSQT